MPEPFTNAELLKAVEREIALRRRVYPRWIERQRMTQAKADREIELMVAVLETVKAAAHTSGSLI